ARIASGGELSRLMLAIKSLALTAGGSPTLLFDEVDAGIGGSVAEIVGKKLKQVAASHQILCVTHLPQIAALADSHHIVRKEVVKDRTSTTVDKLKEGERIEEVARMLGGIKITERTRRHAEEMVRGQLWLMSPGAARLTRHLLRPSLRFDFFGAVSYAYPDSSPFPPSWGRSSAGRALEWHSRGRRFDPDRLHQVSQWFVCN